MAAPVPAVFNIFTEKEITPFATALRGAAHPPAPVTLTPYEIPYYFIRVLTELSGNRIAVRAFEGDPYREITVPAADFSVVDSSGSIEELEFLVALGLAMPIPYTREFHVHRLATELLYDPTTGLFVNGDDPVRKQRFMHYLRDAVLPGYYWRAFYLTDGLSSSIELTRSAYGELIGIQSAYQDLIAEIGLRP